MSTSQERLFDTIAVLRRASTPLSLTEIAKTLKIAPSSAHAILNVLRAEDVVTIDRDKRYRLGPAVFYLGASYARNTPIYRATWNELVALAHDLGLSTAIAVPWQDHHLILAVNQYARPPIGLGIGSRVPLQGGSYGKAYYAWSGARIPSTLTRFTPATITSITQYRREVQRTKDAGYAIDKEEFVAAIGAVAVAITSSEGYQGLAALMASIDQMNKVGMDLAGNQLAVIASRASVILGDRKRQNLWGAAAD